MNIDDRPTDQRPTDRPQGQFTHFAKFQMAITLQRVNRSPSCLFCVWVFGDGGSNSVISAWIKSKMAAGGILKNFKWPNLCNALSDSLHVCTQTILCPRTLIYNDRDSKFASRGRVSSRPYGIKRKNEKADLEK